jgi:PAS domain S-box-containing protein
LNWFELETFPYILDMTHPSLAIAPNQILIEEIPCFDSDTVLGVVVQTMHSLGCPWVLIGSPQRVEGVFTDHDLVGAIATGVDVNQVSVCEVMTQEFVLVDLQTWLDNDVSQFLLNQPPYTLVLRTDDQGCVTHLIPPRLPYHSMVEAQPMQHWGDRHLETEALRLEQERWQLVLQGSNDGIWDWNLQTNEVFRNPRWSAMLGYQCDELQNKHLVWADLIHPDDREWVVATQQQYLYRQIPQYAVEYRLRCKDGTYKWVLSRGQAVWDEQGQPIRIVGSNTDIDDRKRVEEELRHSQEYYRLLSEVSPVGIFRNDPTGKCIYANAKTLEITGLSLEENLGDGWGKYLHPDDKERMYAAWTTFVERAIAGQEIEYNVEHRYLYPDGTLKWAQAQAVTERQPDGTLVGFVGSVVDITDRKQAEASLQQAQQFLDSIVENAPLSIFVKEAESLHFVLVNKACCEVLGLSQEDMLGKSDYDFFPAEQADFFVAKDRETLRKKQLVDIVEEPIQSQHQGVRYLYTRKVPILDGEGCPQYLLGISLDISDRKKAEEALYELNEELEQRVLLRTQEFQASQQLLQLVFDTLPQRVFWKDRNFRYLGCNRLFAQDAGFSSPEEVLGKEDFDLMWHQSAPVYRAEDIEILESGVSKINFESPQLLDDGTVLWLRTSKLPLCDRNGDIIGIFGSYEDITERKRAEQQLRSERLRLSLALEAADMGTWESNLETGIWSERTEAIFGYAPGTFPGDRDSFLKLVYEEDQERVFQALAHSFTTQSPYNIEYRINHLHGDIRWVAVRGKVVPSEDGDGVRMVGVALDITERKQAEQQLHAEQLRLQIALQAARMGTWECNMQTGKLIWSERSEAIFGYAPGTFPGDRDTFIACIHPDDRERVLQAIAHSFATNDPYHLEYRVIRQDGDVCWIAVWGTMSPNEEKDGMRMVGVVIDISDRKHAEQRLRESEERLRLALTAANQGLYDLNIQTGEAIVSPEYVTMLGYDPLSFHETNAKWIERLHPADMESVARTYQDYVAGKLPDYQVEFRQRTKNGDWKWILSTGKIVMWDENQQPLRMLGIHTDLDERKAAEEAIRTSEERLRAALSASGTGTFRWNLQTDAIEWDDNLNQLLGLQPGTKLYTLADFLALVHPGDRPNVSAGCERSRREGVDFEQEFRVIWPDGSIHWLFDQGRLFWDAEGSPLYMAGACVDISDRKQAELALLQINAELEQRVQQRTVELQTAMERSEVANKAKSLFLANMSHELRTPLNAILGFTQIMAHDQSLPDKHQDYLDIINNSGTLLLNLINDILDLAKIEAGHITLNHEAILLQELLQDLESLLRLRAEAKGLEFRMEKASELPKFILTDGTKLRQVLINLLGNAIKFTDQGCVTLKIWQLPIPDPEAASHSPHHTHLWFEVTDTGVGIAPSQLNTVFDAFVQAHAGQMASQGTGLGLAISRQIVQLMGGDLQARSVLGEGSTFTFWIETEETVLNSPKTPALPIQNILSLAANQPQHCILVVDDVADNRELLFSILTPIGFRVEMVASGQGCLDCWQQLRPDLILMDLRMPGMDGYTTVQKMRQMAPSMTTPILALTASAFESDLQKAMNMGFDGFLTKPVQRTTLLHQIGQLLQVEYYYEASSSASMANPVVISSPTQALTDLLQPLSTEWIERLQQASQACHDDAVFLLLNELDSSQADVVNTLTQLVEQFNFEPIVEATYYILGQQIQYNAQLPTEG